MKAGSGTKYATKKAKADDFRATGTVNTRMNRHCRYKDVAKTE